MSGKDGDGRRLAGAGRGRRRFLAWNGTALLALLFRRRWGALLPGGGAALRGREARWYRRVR